MIIYFLDNCKSIVSHYAEGLVQDCSNYIVNAL